MLRRGPAWTFFPPILLRNYNRKKPELPIKRPETGVARTSLRLSRCNCHNYQQYECHLTRKTALEYRGAYQLTIAHARGKATAVLLLLNQERGRIDRVAHQRRYQGLWDGGLRISIRQPAGCPLQETNTSARYIAC